MVFRILSLITFTLFLIATISYLLATLIPKGVIKFKDFLRKNSFWDNDFLIIIVLFYFAGTFIFIYEIITIIDPNDENLKLAIPLGALFGLMNVMFNRGLKAFYFLINSKDHIYLKYIRSQLCNEQSDLRKNIDKNSKTDSYVVVKGLLDILSDKTYIPVLGEQLILLEQMYENIPKCNRNIKVAEYIDSIVNLTKEIKRAIQIEKDNDIKLQNDYFDDYFEDKLNSIIESNNSFSKNIKNRYTN